MSDTRTNAGVDNVSATCKMRSWSVPGERFITLLSAGNLATTQTVVSLLDERSKVPEDRDPSILQAPTMFQVARLVGETLREVIAAYAPPGGPEARRGVHRHPDPRRSDRGHGTEVVLDLPGRQFHRGPR